METTREQYLKKMDRQLTEWSHWLEQLEQRAEKAGADIKKDLQGEISELAKLHAAGKEQLLALESAAATTWDEVKVGCADKWNFVAGSIDAIRARIK